METFRALGIEQVIRAVALPDEHIRFFRGDTLADPNFVVSDPPPTHLSRNTPSPGVLCSQDQLEPVLLQCAVDSGARVLFKHRVTSLRQDTNGVEVAFRVGASVGMLRARYVIGCDGGRSGVRDAAEIGTTGTELGRFLSVRFLAPLGDVIADRAAASYFLSGRKGGFLAIDNDRNWVYQYPLPERTNSASLENDEDQLTRLIRAAAGLPQLPVEVLDTMLWRMEARLADTFRNGRVLLAGDAAHQTPPTGGHGMNVGIGDADTLAWMLADVLHEVATPSLLDQYSAERRPVAEAVIRISSENAARAYEIDDELLLGTHYGANPPVASGPYSPSAAPGRRLPHVELIDDQTTTSTLDLISTEPIVLTATPDAAWGQAAAQIGLTYTAAIEGTRQEVTPDELALKTGLNDGDALLLRPDGHIACHLAADETELLPRQLQLLRAAGEPRR